MVVGQPHDNVAHTFFLFVGIGHEVVVEGVEEIVTIEFVGTRVTLPATT
jgi:hypothetical protein